MTQNNRNFRNLSVGFIVKIFYKFCKFQPRYSYKIHSFQKKNSVVKTVVPLLNSDFGYRRKWML